MTEEAWKCRAGMDLGTGSNFSFTDGNTEVQDLTEGTVFPSSTHSTLSHSLSVPEIQAASTCRGLCLSARLLASFFQSLPSTITLPSWSTSSMSRNIKPFPSLATARNVYALAPFLTIFLRRYRVCQRTEGAQLQIARSAREPLDYRPPATMCSECNAIAPNFLIKQERVS